MVAKLQYKYIVPTYACIVTHHTQQALCSDSTTQAYVLAIGMVHCGYIHTIHIDVIMYLKDGFNSGY